MFTNSKIRCAVALSLLLAAAAPTASGGDLGRDDALLIRNSQGIVGGGHGLLGIPDFGTMGYFAAHLQDRDGADRYLISAKTSRYLPGFMVYPPEFDMGGIYGVLREAPAPGVFTILPLPVIGYVEGVWHIDENERGSFQILIYLRDAEGEPQLAGIVVGDFKVRSEGGVVHPPLRPPGEPPMWTIDLEGRHTLDGASSRRPSESGNDPPDIVHYRLSTRPDLVSGSSSTGIDGPLAKDSALNEAFRSVEEPDIQPGKLELRYKLFR